MSSTGTIDCERRLFGTQTVGWLVLHLHIYLTPLQISDPFVNANVFAQTLCDDFGIAAVNHSKVISSIVSSITEQITDFRSHHVEVDHSLPPPAKSVKPSQLIEGKPEIVVTEPGSGAQNKQVIKLVEGIDRKRIPTGSGWFDQEEAQWWERWRRHVARLDERIAGVTLGTKKRGKKRRKDKTQPLAITNGEVMAEVVDFLGVPLPAEIKDEFAEQVLVVDYDEEEKEDGSVNEDLRVVIKVAIFQVACPTCETLTLAH